MPPSSDAPTLAKRPVVLIVRDGWGKNPVPAVEQCQRRLPREASGRRSADGGVSESTLIHTSGFDVGLPEGTMGNSEVGHQNIGAGRDRRPGIGRASPSRSATATFFDNAELNAAVDNALKNGTNLHLFGIVSDAGVHGLLEHLYGCLELVQAARA